VDVNAPGRVRPFLFAAVTADSTLRLPVRARSGDVGVVVRAAASYPGDLLVRQGDGQSATMSLGAGAWRRRQVQVHPDPADGGIVLELRHRAAGSESGTAGANLFVDYVELSSTGGLVLGRPARLALAAVPLLVALFGLVTGTRPVFALAAAAAAAAGTVALSRWAPLPVVLAIPRLLPVALAGGLLAGFVLRRSGVAAADRRGLAWLVAAGILAHGSPSFCPDHRPPDLDVHIVRALDAQRLPLDYRAWLEYGSHLPTASQRRGEATDLFGHRALVPYSPLPYFAYAAADLAGLDLDWAMTVLTAALAMLVAPAVFLAARACWNLEAAWVAALLYGIDLAVWHHVGRVHSPAAVGAALGTLALLYLVRQADSLTAARTVAAAAGLLALGALGYTSEAVLLGLAGAVLLALLGLDARAIPPRARAGIVAALVLGGALAGAVYYFHYVPGLLRGVGTDQVPDIFRGQTFAIFRNEAKQSMRVWRLGFDVWLVLGLAAAPFALARSRPARRPVLLAWFGGWVLLMILKDPAFFPRALRWAKEDQFLSPLLCLLIAGGLAWVRPVVARRALTVVVLAVMLRLQVRDFLLHVDSLRL
jgi:hypothetical protein